MKQETIKTAISLINEAIEKKQSLNQLCVQRSKPRNFIANIIWGINVKDNATEEEEELLMLYNQYLDIKNEISNTKTVKEKPLDYDSLNNEEKHIANYDAYEDDNYDDRSYGEPIRDGEEIVLHNGVKTNKITEYYYNIKVKGEEDLVGYLTREEMNLVYRLYSNMDGAGLTQRVVSRHFKNLNFRDFKRILRAFNITKASHPVAPHIIEEKSLNEVVDIIYRNKENNLFKKLEEERSKQTEKILKEKIKENVELQDKLNGWGKMVNDVLSEMVIGDIEPFEIKFSPVEQENALIVYLSDMHVGAKTKEDSIYENKYDEKEFNLRLTKTIQEIVNQHSIFGRFDKIIICNLGDSLDGYDGNTTRGGHGLPQNMDNKKQYNVYMAGMRKFFESLHELNLANNIDYICVGDANHDGDFGYVANKSLEMFLELRFPNMGVRIFEKFIESFEYGDHIFILSHGKDKEEMKNGFPLNLTDKVENFFHDFIYNNQITHKYCHVISGDQHQTSVNYGKRFRYKKVASMYGSSKWIHTNFGNTKAAVDFEIVPKNRSTILEGRIVLV
jgi:hypothetical protein